MVNILRTVKDRLTLVRDSIPTRAKAMNEMVQALRRYEDGLEELEGWIETSERMLKSYEEEKMLAAAEPVEMENRLKKHKVRNTFSSFNLA